MNKLLFLIGLVSLAACSQDEGVDANNTAACKSAKCDSVSLAELTAIESNFGLCTVTPDLDAADDFFALEEWTCQFVGFEAPLPLTLRNVFAWTKQAGGQQSNAVTFAATELDGTSKRSGTWRIDKYPVTTVVNPAFSLVTSDSGRVGESNPRTSGGSLRIENLIEARPTEPTQHAISANMKFWPVVIWPTAEFARKFEGGEISFFSVDITGEVAISDNGTTKTRYGRYAVKGDNLKALPNKTFLIPVQVEYLPAFEVRLESNDVTSTGAIDGPGYYLMGVDGALTRASITEVTERGMSRATAIPAPTQDMGPDGSVDAGVDAELDVPAPLVDPCGDTCAADQACVNAECVSLANQRQSSCNSTATASCDGEDTDCAEGNICSGGKCRLLTCQTQTTSCYAATAVCEESTDCAADHVCTSGTCTRLSCKQQTTSCYAATGVCEDSDSECPADHACAGGLCKRLTCQAQTTSCYAATGVCDGEDSDCPDAHACVAGTCRRLTCQAQSTSCYTAAGVCDEGEASDCPDGHVCESGKCKRLTCL